MELTLSTIAPIRMVLPTSLALGATASSYRFAHCPWNHEVGESAKNSGHLDDAPLNHLYHAIGRWVSGAGQVVSSWTVKKYALPDKTVASQILIYRQLWHTSCRPGLVLSRKYEATPAQVSVQHMPWWETVSVVDETDHTQRKVLTMVDTVKMVISYDNLITRLWNTALERHDVLRDSTESDVTLNPAHLSLMCEVDLLDPQSSSMQPSVLPLSSPSVALSKDCTKLPPIPHEYWVSLLGFQQTDPVTDFCSGGILSLVLMFWIVERCLKSICCGLAP